MAFIFVASLACFCIEASGARARVSINDTHDEGFRNTSVNWMGSEVLLQESRKNKPAHARKPPVFSEPTFNAVDEDAFKDILIDLLKQPLIGEKLDPQTPPYAGTILLLPFDHSGEITYDHSGAIRLSKSAYDTSVTVPTASAIIRRDEGEVSTIIHAWGITLRLKVDLRDVHSFQVDPKINLGKLISVDGELIATATINDLSLTIKSDGSLKLDSDSRRVWSVKTDQFKSRDGKEVTFWPTFGKYVGAFVWWLIRDGIFEGIDTQKLDPRTTAAIKLLSVHQRVANGATNITGAAKETAAKLGETTRNTAGKVGGAVKDRAMSAIGALARTGAARRGLPL